MYGLGHMRSRAALKEADLEGQGFRTFLDAAAAWVSHVLTRRIPRRLDGGHDPNRIYGFLNCAEDVFSCQVGGRVGGWSGGLRAAAQLGGPACLCMPAAQSQASVPSAVIVMLPGGVLGGPSGGVLS